MATGRFKRLKLGSGLTGTAVGGDVIEISAAVVAVATDSLWDAKGDLAAGTGANTAARLPVGSNGQALVADSTQTTGLRWATAAAGGASPADTAAWMPLTSTVAGDDVLVFDANHQLIPTFTPL